MMYLLKLLVGVGCGAAWLLGEAQSELLVVHFP